MTPDLTKLIEAADAVINRWDSPQWEWDKHGNTGNLIADLRAAKSKLLSTSEQSVPQPPEPGYRMSDEDLDRMANDWSTKRPNAVFPDLWRENALAMLTWLRDNGYFSPTTEARVAFTEDEMVKASIHYQKHQRGEVVFSGNDFLNGLRYANTHGRVVSREDIEQSFDDAMKCNNLEAARSFFFRRLTELFNNPNP